MSILKEGCLAKVISSGDERNIGKIVGLYAYHEVYKAQDGNTYFDTWHFNCNDGFYVNGNKRFTNIGTEAKDLEFYK